jgi:hypothetical protein
MMSGPVTSHIKHKQNSGSPDDKSGLRGVFMPIVVNDGAAKPVDLCNTTYQN